MRLRAGGLLTALMFRHALAAGLIVLVGCSCGGSAENPSPDATPPTYTELFNTYFGPGTPGHCSNAGCHGDPDHNIWMCPPTKDGCYAGMVAQGLITPADPTASPIGSRTMSPLVWVNPNGPMPFDNRVSNRTAGDAVMAWVAAGAQNN